MSEEKDLFDYMNETMEEQLGIEDEAVEEETEEEEEIVWPTISSVDLDAIREEHERRRNSRHIENVEQSVRNEAVRWVVENKIAPIVEGGEFYSAQLIGWTAGYQIQFPLRSREDVDQWCDLFRAGGWVEESERKDKEIEDKERVNNSYGEKGHYLRFEFNPGKELLEEIKERFDYTFKYVDGWEEGTKRTYEFSQWTIKLHLDFFPTNSADCQITDLGEIEETTTRRVFEVTCKEGAEEMRTLLGGDDAG